MMERQRDIVAYAVVATFSCALLFWIIPRNMPKYPGYGVPASMLPNVAAGFMLVLSLLGLCRCMFMRAKSENNAVSSSISALSNAPINWAHLVLFLAPCFALMPAMSHVGFLPAGMIFMLIIQLLCKQRRLFPLVLVSVLPVWCVYAIMSYVLGVPLP